jgi:hypothetical protein
VASIEQFGDLEAVGKRLLDAERKKVGGVACRNTAVQQLLSLQMPWREQLAGQRRTSAVQRHSRA